MKTKNLVISSVLAGALMLGGQVHAGDKYRQNGHYDNNASQSFKDYARVTHVEPRYRTVQVDVPRQQCWQERVSYREPDRRHQRSGAASFTPEILGAVVGAAAGRKFGRGRGQDAATVAGALLGGSIGRDIKRRNGHRGSNDHNRSDYGRHETIERCETVNDYRTEERIDGYRVEYEYEGRRYSTTMNRDPGDKIPVNVSVSPDRY